MLQLVAGRQPAAAWHLRVDGKSRSRRAQHAGDQAGRQTESGERPVRLVVSASQVAGGARSIQQTFEVPRHQESANAPRGEYQAVVSADAAIAVEIGHQ